MTKQAGFLFGGSVVEWREEQVEQAERKQESRS